ncbi:MAG: hypothetical protein AAFX06_22440 [Planctomycetota bacterium]
MTSKRKTRQRASFTGDERDQRLRDYIGQSLLTMHVARHSGSPESGLYAARGCFPIAVSLIHRRTCPEHYGRSMNAQLEDLKVRGVVDDITHLNLRRAAVALGEFSSGRDLHEVILACETLQRLEREERRPTPKAKASRDRRPMLRLAVSVLSLGLWRVAS